MLIEVEIPIQVFNVKISRYLLYSRTVHHVTVHLVLELISQSMSIYYLCHLLALEAIKSETVYPSSQSFG